MTLLSQMITTQDDKIKYATHLDLLKSIQEIDHGSTNWLHGSEAQSNLWYELSNIRDAIAKELCERLDIEGGIQTFPYGSDPQQVNGKNILTLCEELDEAQVVLPSSYSYMKLENIAKANDCEISDVMAHLESLEEQGFKFSHKNFYDEPHVDYIQETGNFKYPSYIGSEHQRNITSKYEELVNS